MGSAESAPKMLRQDLRRNEVKNVHRQLSSPSLTLSLPPLQIPPSAPPLPITPVVEPPKISLPTRVEPPTLRPRVAKNNRKYCICKKGNCKKCICGRANLKCTPNCHCSMKNKNCLNNSDQVQHQQLIEMGFDSDDIRRIMDLHPTASFREIIGYLLTIPKGKDEKKPAPVPSAPSAPSAPPEPTPEKPVDECRICFATVQDSAFVPCGHICCCLPCAERISNSGQKTCPVCRAAIEKVIKLYKS